MHKTLIEKTKCFLKSFFILIILHSPLVVKCSVGALIQVNASFFLFLTNKLESNSKMYRRQELGNKLYMMVFSLFSLEVDLT